MSKEVAILVENLSKRFRRAGGDAAKTGKRERDAASDPWFWALRDVNMEVMKGGVVGLIGHNGAGKSTLLKIISGIMAPTTGTVKIKGRVASLLEVGTGFHPELTGRENIYLNAAILGIPRPEVNLAFRKIVDFSGVGEFIDMPVKHFSSGMVVRLGFSVAAHLDAEVMIIDEVLAVGDLEFQEKSSARIKGIVRDEGRTVIMVSHNLASVNELCSRCYLLNGGRIIEEGITSEVSDDYVTAVDHRQHASKVTYTEGERPGDAVAVLVEAGVVDAAGSPTDSVDLFSPVGIRIRYEVMDGAGRRFVPGLWFHGTQGQVAFTSAAGESVECGGGRYESVCRIPGGFLNDGPYYVSLSLSSESDGKMVTHFNESQVLRFVVSEDVEANARRFGYGGVYPGVLRPILEWETEGV